MIIDFELEPSPSGDAIAYVEVDSQLLANRRFRFENYFETRTGDQIFLGIAASNLHDKTAANGVEYIYSIASVDTNGTEGPSASVTVVAR